MNTNISSFDRLLRLAVSIAIVVFFVMNIISGIWGIIWLIAGFVLTVSSFLGFCPVYFIFGIKKGQQKKA